VIAFPLEKIGDLRKIIAPWLYSFSESLALAKQQSVSASLTNSGGISLKPTIFIRLQMLRRCAAVIR
jgi:hypothetical protein